jgi:hypothetical protein
MVTNGDCHIAVLLLAFKPTWVTCFSSWIPQDFEGGTHTAAMVSQRGSQASRRDAT